MTAKEYLKQVQIMDQCVKAKLQQVDLMRSLTQKITVSYGNESVAHSRNVSSMENAVIRLMEAEEDLNRQINAFIEIRVQIAAVIDQVGDAVCRLILEKRYLCFEAWDDICADLGYSRSAILAKHEKGIHEVESILNRIGSTESVDIVGGKCPLDTVRM